MGKLQNTYPFTYEFNNEKSMAELRFKYLFLAKFLIDKNVWSAYCNNLKKFPTFVPIDKDGKLDTSPEAITWYDLVINQFKKISESISADEIKISKDSDKIFDIIINGADMDINTLNFPDILIAFDWEKTQEGEEFWHNLKNEFNESFKPSFDKFIENLKSIEANA